MPLSESFLSFILDQLEGLNALSARRMFGGAGLYSGARFFGILHNDALYLKVGDSNRGRYEEAGMKPFRPYPGRSTALSYFTVPASVVENRSLLLQWARESVDLPAKRPSTGPAKPQNPKRHRKRT